MKRIIATLLACAALAAQALAQSPPYPPSMPPRTVVGNMTTVTGPGRAVQLAQLQAAILFGETPISDANYSLVAADRTIAYTALTASRTVTLLPAASYTPGTQLFFLDRSGNSSSTKTISIAPSGADQINGANATTAIINAPYVIVALESDGVSKWVASAALSTATAPFFAVVNPSSGNFIGCGNPTAHQLQWSDCNPQFNADVMQFFSSDPSAVVVVTLGGTPVAGDLYTLNFIYNSNTVSVFYTVQSGDTLAKVAAQLVCAVTASSTLFNLNGGTCSTSTGVVTAAANASYGGYGNSALIGYIVPVGTTQFAFDYNSAISLQMSYTVSGAHTETVTLPAGFYRGPQFTGGTSGGSANAQTVAASGFTRGTGTSFTFTAGFSNSGSTTINVQSTGIVTVKKNVGGSLVNLAGGEIVSGTSYTAVDNGTNYVLNMNSALVAGGSTQSTSYTIPNALDNNPAKVDSRNAGVAPPTASTLSQWAVTGATSACASTRCVTYGDIAHYVGNSVSGNLQSAWIIQAQGGNGSYQNGGGGLWVGQGIYGNGGSLGGSPFNGGLTDQGPATANFSTYYINNTYTLTQSGSTFQIASNNTNPITLSSSGGVGVNVSPSANGEFQSGLGFFVTGAQVPSTGTGVSTNFASSAGNIISKDYGASTFKALNLQGSTIALAPSGSATSGTIMQANAFIPAADNVTQSGSSLNRWTSMHTLTSVLYGATSGSLTVKCAATCGSNTLTWPAGTTDFSATGGTSQVVKQTSAGGAFTVAQLAASDLSNGTTGSGSVVLNTAPTFSGVPSFPGGATMAGNLQVVYASANFSLSDTGTSFAYFQIIGSAGGTPARMRIGSEGSAGNALFTGSGANAAVVGSFDNNPLQFFTNNALRGQFTAAGDLSLVNNIIMTTATKTLTLKQGANGTVGTFVCTSGGTITINNTNVAITDAIIISLNTVGGTISTNPTVNAITASTSFTAKCATSDTSTYNYAIIKNAA